MPEEISAQELEQLLQMMTCPSLLTCWPGIGLLMGVLCGLTFGRQVQNKLDGWKQDRLPLLPSGDRRDQPQLCRHPDRGDAVHRLLPSDLRFRLRRCLCWWLFVLSLLTGGALFAQLERLMQQVEEGKFKAVDFDNFDEFF